MGYSDRMPLSAIGKSLDARLQPPAWAQRMEASIIQEEDRHAYSVSSPEFPNLFGRPEYARSITAGRVEVDTSVVEGDPSATVRKMELIKEAALAPVKPSEQDRKVAKYADDMIFKARREIEENKTGGRQNLAKGYVPNFVSPVDQAVETMGAISEGYKPGKVVEGPTVPGVGKTVINEAEKVVTSKELKAAGLPTKSPNDVAIMPPTGRYQADFDKATGIKGSAQAIMQAKFSGNVPNFKIPLLPPSEEAIRRLNYETLGWGDNVQEALTNKQGFLTELQEWVSKNQGRPNTARTTTFGEAWEKAAPDKKKALAIKFAKKRGFIQETALSDAQRREVREQSPAGKDFAKYWEKQEGISIGDRSSEFKSDLLGAVGEFAGPNYQGKGISDTDLYNAQQIGTQEEEQEAAKKIAQKHLADPFFFQSLEKNKETFKWMEKAAPEAYKEVKEFNAQKAAALTDSYLNRVQYKDGSDYVNQNVAGPDAAKNIISLPGLIPWLQEQHPKQFQRIKKGIPKTPTERQQQVNKEKLQRSLLGDLAAPLDPNEIPNTPAQQAFLDAGRFDVKLDSQSYNLNDTASYESFLPEYKKLSGEEMVKWRLDNRAPLLALQKEEKKANIMDLRTTRYNEILKADSKVPRAEPATNPVNQNIQAWANKLKASGAMSQSQFDSVRTQLDEKQYTEQDKAKFKAFWGGSINKKFEFIKAEVRKRVKDTGVNPQQAFREYLFEAKQKYGDAFDMNQVIKFAETHPEFKEGPSQLVAKMGPAGDERKGGLRERGFGLRVMDYLTMPPEELQEQLNRNEKGNPITTEQATWTQKALAYVKNPKKFKELLTQTAPSKRKLILENIRELGLGAQIPKYSKC